MKYSTLAPRGGSAVTDIERLQYLSANLHTVDDYGIDNVNVCLGSLEDEAGAYIVTRSFDQTWAWSFEDSEQAAAAFRHFHASPFSDWAYIAADSALITPIATHGLLPHIQLADLPPNTIRFYRTPEACKSIATPAVLRFPWPDQASPAPEAIATSDEEGRTFTNVWLTSTLPLPIEIDLQVGEQWIAVEEVAHSLSVAAEVARLAANLQSASTALGTRVDPELEPDEPTL